MAKTKTSEILVNFQSHEEPVEVHVTHAQLGSLALEADHPEKEARRKAHQRKTRKQDHGTKGAWPSLRDGWKPATVTRETEIDRQAERDAMDTDLEALTPEELELAATKILAEAGSDEMKEYYSDEFDTEEAEGFHEPENPGGLTAMEIYGKEVEDHLRVSRQNRTKRDYYEGKDQDADNADYIEGIGFKLKQ